MYNETLALVLGIVGIVGSVLGGLSFGVPAAFIFMIVSALGVVISINIKKAGYVTNISNAAFICSLIGLALGALFFIGCLAMCLVPPQGYSCYGCIGGGCKLSCDAQNAYNSAVNSLRNGFGF